MNATTKPRPVDLQLVDLGTVDTDLAGRLTLGQVVKICRWYTLAKTSERAQFERMTELQRRLGELSQAHEVTLAELPSLLEYLTKLRGKYDDQLVGLDSQITTADLGESGRDVDQAIASHATLVLERRAVVSAQSTAEAIALRIEATIKRREVSGG